MSSLVRFRMDFEIEIISVDRKTGVFRFVLKPNPLRYEWLEEEGERMLRDKLDNLIIPESVLEESLQFKKGTPIYFQAPQISSAKEYIASRGEAISRMLDGQEPAASLEDKSGDFLESLAVDELGFVILSLDMVGSTQLASSIEPKPYARVICTLLYELSKIIPKFYGHVLKYTGDGLIAYFPEPSFITKNDLAIDCALTLRALVYQQFNGLLRERAVPEIGLRIGMESGEAFVVTVGSDETKRHKDIVGEVISLAAKIEQLADPGAIYLGDTMERNLHTLWRAKTEPVQLGEEWTYTDRRGKPYLVHRVRES